MIRIIVREAWDNPEGQIIANKYRTFDIEAPELEKLLAKQQSYVTASVVGAEVVVPVDRKASPK